MKYPCGLRALVCALASCFCCAASVPRFAPVSPILSEYQRLAATGDVRASRVLAETYLDLQDLARALQWLKVAAQLGDVEAAVKLGDTLITRDAAAAAKWYERAASSRAEAAWKLGQLYETGQGVPVNLETARELYQRAAGQGNVAAANSLGDLSVLAGDYQAALIWYRSAARQGFPDSLLNLAGLYFQGLGVVRDRAEAYRLAAIAAQLHARDAAVFLNEIARALEAATEP